MLSDFYGSQIFSDISGWMTVTSACVGLCKRKRE